MITLVSSVIRPEGSDLIFDHPYDGDSARMTLGLSQGGACMQMLKFCQPASQLNGRSHRTHARASLAARSAEALESV